MQKLGAAPRAWLPIFISDNPSMAESGDPNENAIAERVFQTLKEDFRLTGFFSFSSAQTSIAKAIYAYNSFDHMHL
ncbi:integrase core domain-containing protein [Dyadobacter alkalitolerans]|uniref:integrase core domain-containing protein n=1 Tax=Dyadobacter alkalitolerans TaxID=492736 RepID=UPI000553DAD9|nr:integrase core domain-containing protein [Dyadobacter alkalitolerans]